MAGATLDALLRRQYRFVSAVEETGGWTIYFPDLPGCMTSAESWEEIGPSAREAFESWMRSEYERGNPIPEPAPYEAGDVWPNGLALDPDDPGPAPAITTQEAAARLGVQRNQMAKLARKYGLGRMIGRARVFTEAEVAGLASRNREVGRPEELTPEIRRWFEARHPGASLDGVPAYTSQFSGRPIELTGRYIASARWTGADGEPHHLDWGGATMREAVEALSAEIDRQAQAADMNGAGDLPGAAS